MVSKTFLNKWHEAIQSKDQSILDELLSDEVVFYSPVIWKAQRGKDITKMYLTAALQVLTSHDFHYVKEIVTDKMLCLEFTANFEDKTINGADIITLNNEGKIIEFKVMVRPLSGMMLLKEKMMEMLQALHGPS